MSDVMDHSFLRQADDELPRSGRLKPGQRPICYNRAPYATTRKVHDGYDSDGRPKMRALPNEMTRECVQHTDGGAAIHFGWNKGACDGCQHLPGALELAQGRTDPPDEPPEDEAMAAGINPADAEDGSRDEGGYGGPGGNMKKFGGLSL